jgi:septum formation protein
MVPRVLYLASASPRRRELLAQIGVEYRVLPVDLDESPAPGEPPEVYVRRLALDKARAALMLLPPRDGGYAGGAGADPGKPPRTGGMGGSGALAAMAPAPKPSRRGGAPTAAPGLGEAHGVLILAADTAVVVGTEVLGKPRDAGEAAAMLRRLSGREHRVLSGVALIGSGVDDASAVSESRVRMRVISEKEIAAYWATGEPADKAGGYAIQGRAAVFVEALTGSYSGVMGLPLFETAALLAAAGMPGLYTQVR